MKKTWITLLLTLLLATARAQSDLPLVRDAFTAPDASSPADEKPVPVYKLKPKVDIPLTLAGMAWSGYAFGKIYSKDPIPAATVLALRPEDVNRFDRWGAKEFSSTAAPLSDLFFYGSMPAPLLLFLDRDIRRDAGKISFLYLESMAVTGLLYTGSTYFTNRYRPSTYDQRLPVSERTGGGQKNSFFAGHVALVGTATFFMARVYNDYHPKSTMGKVLYGGAIAATGITGYLRHRGGKHFPSDIIIGTAVGVLSGTLVPRFHRNRKANQGFSLMPFAGQQNGVTLAYRF